MRFDLTDMRLFLTVVERGSLTQGAQAMHLALASVSERIAGMEAALGAPLLERNHRGVQATPAGAVLVRHARAILDQVEQMRGELRPYATGLKGRIRLLSNTAALAAFLPPHLSRFLARYPDLSIDVDERPSAEIVPALADGRADLGIVADIADLGSLQTHLLHYRIQMRSLDNVGMLVEAGIGIAILSVASAETLRRPELVILPLSEPWAARRLHLCARDFSALTPHAHLLAQQLMESAAPRESSIHATGRSIE
jgi:DNA-binding transcriptional LysR family regulator